MRRVASHYVHTSAGDFLRQHIVEIDSEGYVTSCFPMSGETEAVEWLPGVIELIKKDGKRLRAYHLFPFDFAAMTSCDGTRRTLLR